VTDFAKLLRVLHAGNVEHIVIGGLAATIHGSARLTQDVDVCYSRRTDNLDRLVRALKPLKPYLRGAPPGLPFDWSVATVRAGLNFTLTTTAGSLDLIGDVAGGGTYEELLPHTVVVSLFGNDVKALDLEWLILTKRAAGRPRDLEAIAELEALKEERES
jgi:predicted nucleotidyltransferase